MRTNSYISENNYVPGLPKLLFLDKSKSRKSGRNDTIHPLLSMPSYLSGIGENNSKKGIGLRRGGP